MGEKVASQLQHRVDKINAQLVELFEDTLKVGEIVGEMQQMVKKGENAGQELQNFIEETRARLGVK
jgi:signal transduction protein with GAF and PtsI domain